MSAAAEEEANHWPGFVDALSTIVMVVTFLLIILAIAIFVTSLTIADIARQDRDDLTASNLETGRTITVEENPVPRLSDVGVKADLQTKNMLRLHFLETTINLDETSVGDVNDFVATHPQMLTDMVEIISYFGNQSNVTQQKRIAYYRALSVRNIVLETGVPSTNINFKVLPAPNEKAAGSVIVATR